MLAQLPVDIVVGKMLIMGTLFHVRRGWGGVRGGDVRGGWGGGGGGERGEGEKDGERKCGEEEGKSSELHSSMIVDRSERVN